MILRDGVGRAQVPSLWMGDVCVGRCDKCPLSISSYVGGPSIPAESERLKRHCHATVMYHWTLLSPYMIPKGSCNKDRHCRITKGSCNKDRHCRAEDRGIRLLPTCCGIRWLLRKGLVYVTVRRAPTIPWSFGPGLLP